jgi:serine/threonine protein kinase
MPLSLTLPELDPKYAVKIEPHLMKDSYKKVHIYLFDFNVLLGKGSFSSVYKGINLITSKEHINNLDEDVAVKVIDMSSVNSPKLKQLLLQ